MLRRVIRLSPHRLGIFFFQQGSFSGENAKKVSGAQQNERQQLDKHPQMREKQRSKQCAYVDKAEGKEKINEASYSCGP